MPPINKLYEKTLKTTVASGSRFTFGELQGDGTFKVRTILDTDLYNIVQNDSGVESILYVNLKDLADGTNIGGQNPTLNRLVRGKFYLITDATAANIPLMVQATSASTIGTDAKSPDYPQDQINYNFLTDTILQRYDSINDILVCQDLRNLVGLTIGSNCSSIKCGANVTGSIGANSNNLDFGDYSTISVAAGSTNIVGGASSSYSNTQTGTHIFIQSNSGITSDVVLSNLQVNFVVINITGSAEKAIIEGNSGALQIGEGDVYFTYITGGVLTTILVTP